MKKMTNLVPRWRTGALACAAALLLAGCGAANDSGLSNGPQMAAATTDVPADSGAAAAPAEPVAAEPAVAAAEPAPAPASAGAAGQAATQADSFAMTGYGSAAAKPAEAAAAGNQAGAPQDAGQAASTAPVAAPATDGAATPVAGIPAMPDATQASAVPVPNGGNRSAGLSGAGIAVAGTEPEMCKYGSCSFR
jgi:hypothetical protein